MDLQCRLLCGYRHRRDGDSGAGSVGSFRQCFDFRTRFLFYDKQGILQLL